MKNKNIELFDKWAQNGKDVSMENGHSKSVDFMLKILDEKSLFGNKFSFLDLGCGNGWVVKKISKNNFCNLAVGIDGSENMIKNAKLNSKDEIFINENIENWHWNKKFNIVFSMETLYYVKDIDCLLKNIYSNLLIDKGSIIIGVDHYLENKPSLMWGEDYNLDIVTLSVKQWEKLFLKNKFKNIKLYFTGQKDDWNGTLVIYAQK